MDPNNQENNPEQEQEKFEDANERNEDKDSDYYSFENIKRLVLEIEHGSIVSKDDTINEDGTYNLNLDGKTDEEVLKMKKRLYDYYGMKKVMFSFEFDAILHIKYFEKSGFMDKMNARFRKNVLLGINYNGKRVIVRREGLFGVQIKPPLRPKKNFRMTLKR